MWSQTKKDFLFVAILMIQIHLRKYINFFGTTNLKVCLSGRRNELNLGIWSSLLDQFNTFAVWRLPPMGWGRRRGQDECGPAVGGAANQAFAAEEEDVAAELQGEAVRPHQEPADILRWKSWGRVQFLFICCIFIFSSFSTDEIMWWWSVHPLLLQYRLDFSGTTFICTGCDCKSPWHLSGF